MKLSNQAMGALMMALQKSILTQTDIIPVLTEFDFSLLNDELVVDNPPVVALDDERVVVQTDAQLDFFKGK